MKKELNAAKCYTPNTKIEDVEQISMRLWKLLLTQELCGKQPTLQKISEYKRFHFVKNNFGVKAMVELDAILAVAGLEIANDSPIYVLID